MDTTTTTRLAHPTGELDPAAGLDTSDQLACGTELTSILATDTLGPPENVHDDGNLGRGRCRRIERLRHPAAHAGPRAFDPPPGDIGQLPLINNTSHDLHFFECDPATSSSGFNPHPLPPRRRHTSNTNSAQAPRSGSPTPPGHWWAA